MKKLKGLVLSICMILILSGMVCATEEYYTNDVTPPFGRIEITELTKVDGSTNEVAVTVQIYAKDDRCTDSEIKYYLSSSEISNETAITGWEDYTTNKTDSINVTSGSKIYAVFKDKNGNTSHIYNSGSLSQNIVYDVNEGTNAPTGTNGERIQGMPFVVTSQMPKKEGYYFLGWSIDSAANTPTFRAGDIIPADMELGSSETVTLYAVWSDDETVLPEVAEMVKVGDYVNYPVFYDNVSADGIATNYEGWRVISIEDDGTINLVSAGVPLTYYHAETPAESVTKIVDNFVFTGITMADDYTYRQTGLNPLATLTDIFSNKYTLLKENGVPKVRSIQSEDVLSVTGASSLNLNDDLSDVKYRNLFEIGQTYWLASDYTGDDTSLLAVDTNGIVTNYSNAEYGVRPIVTLKPEVRITGVDMTGAWNIKMALCTISFNANGGSGTMENATIDEYEEYTLPESTFTAPDGMIFDKWSVNGTTYAAGETITIRRNIEITATWKAGKIADVEGLGEVEVSDPDAELTYNPDDGELGGVVPPSEDEPETPEEIPEEKLKEIEFGYGSFESKTTFTPGEYEVEEYETTYTTPKYPVAYNNVIWSEWIVTKDAEGNVTKIEPGDIQLADIEDQYSTYIVYDFETEEYLETDGVKGDSVELWTIFNTAEDSLDNAVYLAAYLNKLDGKKTRHIAQWNGTQYVEYDADEAISAVDTFVETHTQIESKTVEITAPSSSTEYVYVPIGTLKAVEGMTWAKWLESEYNTTGETEPTIKTSDYVDVAYESEIIAGKDYGFAVSASYYTDSDTNKKVYILSDSEITNSSYKGNTNISEVLQAEGETTQVPVPTGFTYYLGTGDTGLVVKDASDNEFVWIPVNLTAAEETAYPDRSLIGDMFTTVTTAVSMNHYNTSFSVTTKQYGNHNLNSKAIYTSYTMGAPNSTSYREPAVVVGTGSQYDAANYSKAGDFASLGAFATDLRTEFDSMIASVGTYGGFYVGRYELGLNGSTVVCKPGQLVLTAAASSNSDSYGNYGGTPDTSTWYGLYKACKGFTQGGVQSAMIWGTQWDAMVNYIGDHTTAKPSDNKRYLTGQHPTLNADHYKHVHDTSSNVSDWTATAFYPSFRAARGGYYDVALASCYRSASNPTVAFNYYGSRPQLYIK